VPVVGRDPGHEIHLGMSLMLDHDVPPMPWIRLCMWACPSTSEALDTKMCKLCQELLLLPEPEVIFCDLECEQKAPLI
jgi:hypothetical protein